MYLNNESALPLKGLRVIDWSTAVAAPACGRLLADMGADVIKIESPKGDMCRTLGNAYDTPNVPEEESYPFHITANTNKRFITLDWRTEEGMDVFMRLLKDADVLLTSVRTKVLQAMGLSYEDLKSRFPRLILAHLTGFGYEGDEAERPGYDVAAFWARSGGLIDWVRPGSTPVNPGLGLGDIFTGTNLCVGLLSALYARQATGKGTLVTTSLMSAGIWGNGNYVLVSQPPFNHPVPLDPADATNPFFTSYKCKDGVWMTLVMPGPLAGHWERGCRAFGLEAYIDDPRFGSDANVTANHAQAALYQLMCDAVSRHTYAEWHERLLTAEVVHERIQRSCEVVNDPQAIANGYVKRITLPDNREATFSTIPIQFSEYGVKPINPLVSPGQDTRKILEELDYSQQQIEAMYEKKAVR